jgi:DNA-binding HxlR family transcriptional regulator
LRPTLDRAITRDWVRRNPGYGHPLRPEYLPTELGSRLGRAARPLLVAVRRQGLEELAGRKWTMPVLLAVADGAARFSEIKAVLGSVTDRALAQALRELIAGGLVRRRVLDTHPPASRYVRGRRGASLVRALRKLAQELSESESTA